jgi:hypothetical protein
MRTNWRQFVCLIYGEGVRDFAVPGTVFETIMPRDLTAPQDDDRAAERTTRRPCAAVLEDAEEGEQFEPLGPLDQPPEDPTTTIRHPRRRPKAAGSAFTATTTMTTTTLRLVLAALVIGAIRLFLTDVRQRMDGGSHRISYSSNIKVVAPSVLPSDAPGISILEGATSGRDDGGERGGVEPSVSIAVAPPRSGSQGEAHPSVRSSTGSRTSASQDGPSTTSPSTTSSSCSCLNSFSNGTCCARTVLRAHKFGFRLAAEWLGKLRDAGELVLTASIDSTYLRTSSSESADYRHVVMVRNYVEAFVSGYLYHKSGRECWLDPEGAPNHKTGRHQGNMEWVWAVQAAQARHGRFGRYPRQRNRSLCQYLADESERNGMKVYVAYALEHWYYGLKSYLQQTKRSGLNSSKSYFVCLEDASDPRWEKDWYDATMDHLYPGSALDRGGRYAHPFPKPVVVVVAASSNVSGNDADAAYHGGHATSHDPDLRQRLTRLVTELDRDVFDGRISSTDKLIGCGGGTAQPPPPP